MPCACQFVKEPWRYEDGGGKGREEEPSLMPLAAESLARLKFKELILGTTLSSINVALLKILPDGENLGAGNSSDSI